MLDKTQTIFPALGQWRVNHGYKRILRCNRNPEISLPDFDPPQLKTASKRCLVDLMFEVEQLCIGLPAFSSSVSSQAPW